MKTIYWMFAVVVFVVSLTQPAFACGSNGSRYAPTNTARTPPAAPAPQAGPAQGAGMAPGTGAISR